MVPTSSLPRSRPQGPESEVELVKGSSVLVTVDPEFRMRGDAKTVWVDYPNIVRVVPVGGHIYIDDGLISLVVRKIGADAPPHPSPAPLPWPGPPQQPILHLHRSQTPWVGAGLAGQFLPL